MCPEYPASRIRIPQVSSNRVVDYVLCRTCMVVSCRRSCALVSSQIDTDSSVFVATEGGDEIVFSNFNASSHSESTHWKLFVDDEYSTEDNCVTFSSNNSMTCKIPASSGQDKRLSLMKYVVFEREAREL